MRVVFILYILAAVALNFWAPGLYSLLLSFPAVLFLLYLLRQRKKIPEEGQPPADPGS